MQENVPLFGSIAVEWGLITPEELEECLRNAPGESSLKQILQDKGLIDDRVREMIEGEVTRRSSDVRAIKDRYIVEKKVAEGGMAVVYRARDRELNREVALKVLRDNVASKAIHRTRFRREAQSIARLSHPNVVTVHDVGEDGGRLYLVMELVEGESLDHLYNRERPKARWLAALLAKVSHAVHEAHRQGVVHRDLKPANILVSRRNEPKVADFGLAHLMEPDAAVTRSGTQVGTPLYMAPEQIEAKAGKIGPATDVYAIGAILYQGLTGRPPFPGRDPETIYYKVLSEPAEPPRSIDPTIPEKLEAVALRAMEKDPRDRYISTEELANDLERFLAGEPVEARPPTPAERFWRDTRDIRRVALPVAAVFGVAGLLLGLWLGFGKKADPIPEKPPIVETDHEKTERRRRALNLIAQAQLKLDGVRDYLRRPGAVFEEVNSRADGARVPLLQAMKLDAELPMAHYLLGWIDEIKGDWDSADLYFTEALELDPKFAPAHYRKGKLLLTRAYLASLGTGRKGRMAKDIAGRVADHFGKTVADDPVRRALVDAVRALARHDHKAVLRITGHGIQNFPDHPGVEDLHWLRGTATTGPEALSSFDAALQLRPNHLMARFGRALERSFQGREAEAIEDYNEVLALQPSFQVGWYNRGLAQYELGRLPDSLRDFSEAIRLDPKDYRSLVNRAMVRSAMGQHDEAIQDCDRAIAINHQDPIAFYNRALSFQDKKNFKRAIADYDAAIRLDPEFVAAYVNRGIAREDDGDRAGAVADYTAALKRDPAEPIALFNRGLARYLSHNLEDAITDFEVLLKIEPENVAALVNKGLCHVRRKEFSRAIVDFTEAIRLDPKDVHAFFNRADARFEERNYRGAVEDYTAVLRLKPDDFEAHGARAFALCELGERAKAIDDVKKALKLAPTDHPGRKSWEEELRHLIKDRDKK